MIELQRQEAALDYAWTLLEFIDPDDVVNYLACEGHAWTGDDVDDIIRKIRSLRLDTP